MLLSVEKSANGFSKTLGARSGLAQGSTSQVASRASTSTLRCYSTVHSPFTVEALVTPLTEFDHGACLDVHILGMKMAHPIEAKGAYIHA